MIKEIKAAVTIPVMAKARIGHFVEAQILEAVGIDYIDESEVRGEGPACWSSHGRRTACRAALARLLECCHPCVHCHCCPKVA